MKKRTQILTYLAALISVTCCIPLAGAMNEVGATTTDTKNHSGERPLLRAVMEGDRNTDPEGNRPNEADKADRDGTTPLMKVDHKKIVKDQSPCLGSCAEASTWAVANNPDKGREKFKEQLLDYVHEGNVEKVKSLLTSPHPVGLIKFLVVDQQTFLHVASWRIFQADNPAPYFEIIEFLVNYGADVYARNIYGQTPLQAAKEYVDGLELEGEEDASASALLERLELLLEACVGCSIIAQ